MSRKILLIIIAFSTVLFAAGIDFNFFVIPPRVISTFPYNNDLGVDLNSPLVIKFDKPIGRQQLNHIISPQVYGEWDFKDNLASNHLFKTLVFTPAVGFKPNTRYQVNIEGIKNSFLSVGLSNNFSFDFKTKNIIVAGAANIADAAVPVSTTIDVQNKITIIDTPFYWQEHNLSCEAASLRMALVAKGINVQEDDIINKIGVDTTYIRNGNVWGNPQNAFVGDVNGKSCVTGYGVYNQAVAKAANYWRPAEAFLGWKLDQLIQEIKLGNPVMFWGVIPVKSLTDCSWYTPDGKYIKAYKQTHVRLVVGFIGDENNPSKIIIKDPLSGELYWSTQEFLTNWVTYDYTGVVIR